MKPSNRSVQHNRCVCMFIFGYQMLNTVVVYCCFWLLSHKIMPLITIPAWVFLFQLFMIIFYKCEPTGQLCVYRSSGGGRGWQWLCAHILYPYIKSTKNRYTEWNKFNIKCGINFVSQVNEIKMQRKRVEKKVMRLVMAVASGPFLYGCDKSHNANSYGKKMNKVNEAAKSAEKKRPKIKEKKNTRTVDVRRIVYIGGKLSP